MSSKDEFESFVNATIQRLWTEHPPTLILSWQAYLMSENPLRWILERMAETIGYVTVFGVDRFNGFISVRDDRMEIGLDVWFRSRIPEQVSRTYYEHEWNDLNVGVQLKQGFSLEVEVHGQRASVAIRMLVPEFGLVLA